MAGGAMAGAGGNGSAGLFALSGLYAGTFNVLCDVDGDGQVDLVGKSSNGGYVAVRRGHGDGTFDAVPVTSSFAGAFTEALDFDGDGRCDLATLTLTPGPSQPWEYTLTAGVHLGQADGTFSPASRSITAFLYGEVSVTEDYSDLPYFVFGDFNHDGRMDFAFAGVTSFARLGYDVFEGTPASNTRAFVERYSVSAAPSVPGTAQQLVGLQSETSLTAGDVDGDGNPDLLLGLSFDSASGSNYDQLAIAHGVGDGTFRTTAPGLVANTPASFTGLPLALIDLDGDGLADLYAPLSTGNQILWNDGAGNFSAGPLEELTYVGDFDADGLPDLLANSKNAASLMLHDGPRSFVNYPVPPPLLNAGGAADLDGDGATDLVFSYTNDTGTGPLYVTAVYLSTAKHLGPASPDIQCGALSSAECAAPAGF